MCFVERVGGGWRGFARIRRRFGGFECFPATEIVVKGGSLMPMMYIRFKMFKSSMHCLFGAAGSA